MSNHNYYHGGYLPHWQINWQLPGLTGLYLNAFLRNLALAMINIFIPLYILNTTKNLGFIFAYYLSWHFFQLLLDYPLVFLVTKIGPDNSSLISSFLLAFHLWALVMVKQNIAFLVLAALLSAILTPLYWIPYHLAFVKLGKQEKYGESFSFLSIFGQITSALGPLMGGFFIAFWGFTNLFILVIILIFISTIPLFFDKFKKTNSMPSWQTIFKGLLSKDYRSDLLAFWGIGMEAFVYDVFWPIFVFSVVESYKTLGIISSASLLLSLIVLFWAGKYVDKKGPGILKIGVAGNSLNWLTRVFLKTAHQFLIADFFYHLGRILLWTPFNAVMYKKAIQQGALEFLTKRELSIHSGGFLAAFVVLLTYLIKPSWPLIFSVGILGLLLSALMIDHHGELKE